MQILSPQPREGLRSCTSNRLPGGAARAPSSEAAALFSVCAPWTACVSITRGHAIPDLQPWTLCLTTCQGSLTTTALGLWGGQGWEDGGSGSLSFWSRDKSIACLKSLFCGPPCYSEPEFSSLSVFHHLNTSWEAASSLTPILQMSKLRPRETKHLRVL